MIMSKRSDGNPSNWVTARGTLSNKNIHENKMDLDLLIPLCNAPDENKMVSKLLVPLFDAPNDPNFVSVEILLQTGSDYRDISRKRGRKTFSALLDTGSLAGNFVPLELIQSLSNAQYVRTEGPMLPVHTASSTIDVLFMVKLRLSLATEIGSKPLEIDIECGVIDTALPLIIGRAVIKKENLVRYFPSNFITRGYELRSVNEMMLTRELFNGLDNDRQNSRSGGPNDDLDSITHSRILSVLIKRKEELLFSTSELDDEIDEGIDQFAHFGLDDRPVVFPNTKEGKKLFLACMIIEGSLPLQARLSELLWQFRDLFSDDITVPNSFQPYSLSVDEEQWRKAASFSAPRPQSVAKEAEIEKQIREMLAADIIEPSTADRYSHVILAPKPGGAWRFCIDFRLLNRCSSWQLRWPLPIISQMIQRLGARKPKIFAICDLTAGYHQCKINDHSRVFTAFIVFMGIYQFKRLPFGLKSAPSYFQQNMAGVVLVGLLYLLCEAYLDDVIIHGVNEDDFISNLSQVLLRFRIHKIRLRAKKCRFGLKEITGVGRCISAEGHSLDPPKVKKCLDWDLPTTQGSLKQFLGLANHFREHVPDHSNLVRPLHALLLGYKKRNRTAGLDMDANAILAFETIKAAIANAPTLFFLNDEDPIHVYTDASDYGFGGYCFQTVDGKERPVALVSQSLTKAQLSWAPNKKEAYAIFKVLKQLAYLVRDRPFRSSY